MDTTRADEWEVAFSELFANTEPTFPLGMDEECVELCAAMCRMPGIETHESCCGHDKNPYRVWFTADGLESLPRLLYWFDG